MVESLFQEAVRIPQHQVEAFLAERCGTNEKLKDLLLALVKKDRALEQSNFLQMNSSALEDRTDLKTHLKFHETTGKHADTDKVAKTVAESVAVPGNEERKS